ncbi:hypothetical protein F4678DRAFT_485233 [Xylaria arbuscula]|nr:hypothetical protein F4678DRAFT_485233 [Xylaria arbuscula]
MVYIDLSSFSPEDQEKILNGPALTPPPGVEPNFDDSQRWKSFGILFANTIIMAGILVLILFRVYTKILCLKKVHIEDYLILPAFLSYGGSVYCETYMLQHGGLFVHQWNVRLKYLGTIQFFLHVGANLCATSIMTLKAAILLDWIRIFVPRGTRNYFYWIGTIVLVLHTTFCAAWIIAENLSCTPHRKIWDITVWQGRCIDLKLLYVPVAAINLLADIIILILPQRTIWTLHMSTRKKFGVASLFTLGILACIAAAVRLYVTFIFWKSQDVTFRQAAMYFWALVEMTCLFFVYCAPCIPRAIADKGQALKAGLKQIFPGWVERTQGEDDTSLSSLQLVLANRICPNTYQSQQRALHLTGAPLGTTTEITVGGGGGTHHVYTHGGGIGILRTRELTTEITNVPQDVPIIEGCEDLVHKRSQRSTLS